VIFYFSPNLTSPLFLAASPAQPTSPAPACACLRLPAPACACLRTGRPLRPAPVKSSSLAGPPKHPTHNNNTLPFSFLLSILHLFITIIPSLLFVFLFFARLFIVFISFYTSIFEH